MINLAMALAFAISSLFSLGGRILGLIIDKPTLQSLPTYQGLLLSVFANYYIPTIIIYFVFRITKIENHIRLSKQTSILLGLANIIFVIYIIARIFASTIQGGGASYAVESYGFVIVWLARLMLIIGLTRLITISFQQRTEPTKNNQTNFSIVEKIVLFIAISLPTFFIISTLFLKENAPFKLAHEARELFEERCKLAGEKIIEVPQNVDSLYLEPDGGEEFNKITDGNTFSGSGSSIIGDPFIHLGFILFYETKNDRQKIDGSTARYRKYIINDWKGQPIENLSSNYGVFQRAVTTADEEQRLQVYGKEITIKNLSTGKITATLVYFTSRRNRLICGQPEGITFNVSDFIKKALGLTHRFSIPTAPLPIIKDNNVKTIQIRNRK